MRFPESSLVRLRSAGLLVAGDFVGTELKHAAFEVVKPSTVSGNSLPGYHLGWDDSTFTDVPPLVVEWRGDRWRVRTISTWAPGPGPEDFLHEHREAEAVVDDILHYLFGESELIEAGRACRLRIRAAIDAVRAEYGSDR